MTIKLKLDYVPPPLRYVGWTLFGVGAATTVPLAMNVVANSRTIKPAVIGGDDMT
jgi:hypothetical protein